MAERVDMSFKNKELKMWFLIMGPVVILGAIVVLNSTPSNRHIPFLILMIGYAIYYTWRFRYRRKKKETDNKQ